MSTNKLTAASIRQAKPRDKDYKIFDGGGLYILVKKDGSKYWRLKYRFGGKERLLSIGVFPEVTLGEAREKRYDARKQLRENIDPSTAKQIQKQDTKLAAGNSFQAVSEEWFIRQIHRWSEVHQTKVRWMLNKNLFPWLGHRPINEISPPELLSALRRVESRGALETAKRTKQVAGQVFRFGVASGYCERDPSQDLKEALATPEKKHLAAVTDPKEVGALLRILDGYEGSPVVRAALQLAPLTFVRPGELRTAEWSEIDWEAYEWRIPASKMKTKIDHIVPLSNQALDVLKDLQPLTGKFKYIFPSARSPRRPMSNNAVLAAMRRMDIPKEQMSGHGFRAMARTILDEVLGYRVDWIEHQLAHAVKDVHGRAYNRTAHLDRRKEMMQRWANYLDQIRTEAMHGNIVAAPIAKQVGKSNEEVIERHRKNA